MRVTGGSARGFTLISPKAPVVRPTTDRVRSALFNIMSRYSVEDSEVADLFAGTGSLGIEALSRGAARVDFVEANIKVAKLHAKKSDLDIKYLHQDLNDLKIKKKYDVILMLEILEHIDNWDNLIKKIKKNLKSSGKLIISTINRNIFSQFFAIFIAEDVLKWIPKKTHEYNKLIKPKELISVLKKK